MTPNNKDAALEPDQIDMMSESELRTELRECVMQLLATQESYHRVVEALVNNLPACSKCENPKAVHYYEDHDGFEHLCGDCHAAKKNFYEYYKGIDEDVLNAHDALANPPSLEAVERKKLEDELAVLTHYSIRSDADALYTMIAEREAKLGELHQRVNLKEKCRGCRAPNAGLCGQCFD